MTGRPTHALHPDSTGIETHCGASWDMDTPWAAYRAPEVTCEDCLLAQAERENEVGHLTEKTRANRRIDACVCYVRDLGEEALFTLRYGAHSLSCPVYRRSGDLADAINDQAFRLAHEKVPQ
jgi:hypothetical protein